MGNGKRGPAGCETLTVFSSVPVVEDERYHFDAADLDRVQRKLKQRHVQMWVVARRCSAPYRLQYWSISAGLLWVVLLFVSRAPHAYGSLSWNSDILMLILSDHQIAGTLGTGLFLGSGKALQGAGPLGALLAYAFVGSIAYS